MDVESSIGNRDPGPEGALGAIEAAMVAIRRSASRRTLSRSASAASAGSGPSDSAVFDVIDAVEAAEQTGALASVSDVAAALSVSQPRASLLIAAAVGAGLLRREADQADGRRALLVRTGAGRDLSARMHRTRRRAFAAATVGWSEVDREAFARLLTRFVAGLAATTGLADTRPVPTGAADGSSRPTSK